MGLYSTKINYYFLVKISFEGVSASYPLNDPLFFIMMVRNTRILLFCILFCAIKTYAQTSHVTFSSNINDEVTLYEPIDDCYNYLIPTRTLKLTANHSVSHTIEVGSFAFIDCHFSQGSKCKLLLFPGDSVNVQIRNKQITFHGSNEAGLAYLHTNFTLQATYMNAMEQFMLEYVAQERDFRSAFDGINQTVLLAIQEDIEKKLSTSTTSQNFIKVLQKDAFIETNSFLVLLLRSLLGINEYKAVALKDSTAIVGQIDRIFQETAPLEKETLRYSEYNFVPQYLIFYYGEESPKDPDMEFLGTYGHILYAPAEMRPILLGKGCIRQLQQKRGNIHLTKAQEYLEKEFPTHEYTCIVAQKIKEEEEKIAEEFPHSYIAEQIDALSQLKNVQELSGKYLFIDLWASWCMPCRKEFAHKDQLDKLISSYGNIATVYLSIDQPAFEVTWKQCIRRYQLSGAHLLVSTALKKEIQEQVYGSNEFIIPRYLLISPEGEILHNNLPRPSSYPQLKDALDSKMKL